MIIFTSICANYAHKARTLANSVRENMPEATFVLCLLEREVPAAIAADDCFSSIVLAKDAWAGNFDRFIFKHDIVEASTAVKGQFFRYLMDNNPDENMFVYLDPDCYVYSDFVELKEELKTHPIILCPHLLSPGNIDMELSSTAHGVYNLGFLAVNHSEEARKFIDWWADRLYLFCYDDIANGIFTDQKWVDLAPCFFNALIFKHKGYDFAPWSLYESQMSVVDGQVYVQGDPLRFIHFSGFGQSAEKCMRDWMRPEDHPFRTLYEDYKQKHNANDSDHISSIVWSYSTYFSGEKIDSSIRKGYRKDWELMFQLETPFALSNAEMKKLLQRGNVSIPKRIVHKIKRAYQVLKTEGVSSFVSKSASTFKRLLKK